MWSICRLLVVKDYAISSVHGRTEGMSDIYSPATEILIDSGLPEIICGILDGSAHLCCMPATELTH